MAAKEKLLREILELDEAEAERARIVIRDEAIEEAEPEALPAPPLL